jgi:hypothetical protein
MAYKYDIISWSYRFHVPSHDRYANTLEPITYDAYWSPVGIYVNTTGNWAEQSAAYHSIAAATTNPTAVTPLVIPQIDAARMRIRAKESATGGGTVNFVFVKNTIN